jgi:hypothetical protein
MKLVQKQVIKCLALRRPSLDYGLELPEWLLCTGVSMGRWTNGFGPWCLAGDVDSKNFVIGKSKVTPGSDIVVFEIHCNSHLLPSA